MRYVSVSGLSATRVYVVCEWAKAVSLCCIWLGLNGNYRNMKSYPTPKKLITEETAESYIAIGGNARRQIELCPETTSA